MAGVRKIKSAPETVMLQMRMPQELHRWLKIKAAAEGVTMKAIMLEQLTKLRNRERAESVVGDARGF